MSTQQHHNDRSASSSLSESPLGTPPNVESWQVSEQLLLAGLREHMLAEQLQLQLAFSQALSYSLGEGVCACNLEGHITFANPSATRMLGQTEAALLGTPIAALLGDDNGELLPDSLHAVLHNGTSYRTEAAHFNRSGEAPLPVAYVAAPILSAEQIVGAVITFRDITELQQLQRTRDETLSLLSHDLLTPLTVIMGLSERLHGLLTQRGLDKEARLADIVLTSGQRMNSMIQEVLDRHFRDTGVHTGGMVPVDLVQLCQRMIVEADNQLEQSRIQLDANVPLHVVANPVQIERVVVNLLSNALKFSPPEAPVLLRLQHDGQSAVVSITDQGIGIAADELPHLFEKFYRTQTSRHIAGNGLGLYGSQIIVEAHGGRMWATSTPGVGSTFTFSLPIAINLPEASA